MCAVHVDKGEPAGKWDRNPGHIFAILTKLTDTAKYWDWEAHKTNEDKKKKLRTSIPLNTFYVYLK